MPTRKQTPDEKQFRQDAFASSVDHERGILANLVAARCQRLTDPEEVAMLWWIQQMSWREGGLYAFAVRVRNDPSAQIATPSMLKLGIRPGRVYNAEQVRVIRNEAPLDIEVYLPLRGERSAQDERRDFLESYRCDGENRRLNREPVETPKTYPDSYTIEQVVRECCLAPGTLTEFFQKALVDPASPSLRVGLWNFACLWNVLCAMQAQDTAAARATLVETEVARKVYEELDFSLETRCFVLIEGREGIGKSESARAWCAQRPGRAVYVRLESGSDETTLYRAIAREIGTACSYGRTAVDMRTRIQDALQFGHLMLVLDEAHFLWPQSERSARSAPKRLDWLRTALIDHGVPVALISTPQYFERQCERFRKSGWNANQIQRRLARTSMLPDALSDEDALRVSQRYFPAATKREALRIAGVAMLTVGYLTTIAHIRKRVDFLASRNPGLPESSLIEKVLAEYIAQTSGSAPVQAAVMPVATPVHGTGRRDAAVVICPDAPAPGNRISHLQPQPA
jgi:DNA transposition AAA+ family ATPase